MSGPGFVAELPVRGRRVLVVGGGDRGLGRIAALRDAGADVHVVAPAVAAAVADLAERGLVRWAARAVTEDDGASAALVVVDDAATAPQVRDWAERRGVFCLEPAAAAPAPAGGVGRVILVGGGPGDPGLLTVAGLAAVRAADVIVTDRLAPLAVLDQAPPGVEIVDVGKIPRGRFTPQERINEVLVEYARAGRTVVRLKGGDNFVFGRGGEEWQACAAAGIEVQVIPGVSSAVGVPALAGIPLTHRTANQGFTVITAHVPPGDPRSTLDYAALARTGTALVILMGVATLPAVTAELIRHGLDPATPAATVADGGLPGQRVVRAVVAAIAEVTAAAGIRPPAITVIGSVAAFDPAVEDVG
ncbi:uroporphyrinogen-III C-methyltransferase [Nakamurella sp.]|uniref:uroporphyrinogen-III C-methyltransferase n=1 Tax=Nakamurella sp. TaxID=1869182 RepID=UPI003B3A56C0